MKNKRNRRRVIGRSDLLTDGMSSMCPIATSKRHPANTTRSALKGIVWMGMEKGKEGERGGERGTGEWGERREVGVGSMKIYTTGE